MPESKVDIRHEVDRKAQHFLSAVQYYGGEATTTEIRNRTGLTRRETNHRFERLEELGLIDVGYAESGYGDRDAPKVAYLTGVARAEIERGLLRDIATTPDKQSEDILSELRGLQKSVDQLENRLNSQNDLLRQIANDIDDLEEYVYDHDEAVETYLYAFRAVVEDELDVSFDEYLQEVR